MYLLTLLALSNSSSNWISSDIALHIESQAKLDMAMHYITNLLKEHPSWTDANIGCSAVCTHNKSEIQQYQVLLDTFEKKLRAGLSCLEQKFSLVSHHLINKMVKFLCNNGLAFIGFQILLCYKEQLKETSNPFGGFHLFPVLPNLLLKATEEMSLFSRYVISCSISSSSMKSCFTADRASGVNRLYRLAGWRFYMQGLMWSLCCFRSMLKLFSGSSADDFIRKTFTMIGLYEYYVYFSTALLQRNLRALNLIVKPLLVTCKTDHAHYEFNLEDLNKLLPETAELFTHDTVIDDVPDSSPPVPPDHAGDGISIPIDEEWHILKALLYGHMSDFLNHQLNSFLTVEEDSSANFLPFRLSVVPDSSKGGLDNSNTTTQFDAVSAALTNLLKSTSAHIYSHCKRQVASSLLQKAGDGFSTPTLQWLQKICRTSSQDHQKQCNQNIGNLNMTNNETELSACEILWKMCADPELLCGGSELNISKWLKYIKRKLPRRWFELYKSIESECETEEINKQEGKLGSPLASNGVGSGSHLKGSPDNSFFLGSRKDTALIKKVMPFESPKEICKRNGELLEAICVNSVNQQQAALASNRKGIVFFNREDGLPSMDKSNYIWSKADWPHDGWAGSESTPVPTCVSPGVGLGSRKGTHLGLGGATVGAGSLAKPGRDFTGGLEF